MGNFKMKALVLLSMAAVSMSAYSFNGKSYDDQDTQNFDKGQIIEYADDDKFCHR